MREQKRKAQIEKKSKLQYHTHSLLPNPQPDRNQSPPRHLSHPPSLTITIQLTKEEKKAGQKYPNHMVFMRVEFPTSLVKLLQLLIFMNKLFILC